MALLGLWVQRQLYSLGTGGMMANYKGKEFPDSGISVEYVVKGSVKENKDDSYEMTVKFAHLDMEVPFCATPNDVMEHGRWLYEQAKAKKFGTPVAYQPAPPTKDDYQKEFDALWPDVMLGLATDEEVARAKELRALIKSMP